MPALTCQTNLTHLNLCLRGTILFRLIANKSQLNEWAQKARVLLPTRLERLDMDKYCSSLGQIVSYDEKEGL